MQTFLLKFSRLYVKIILLHNLLSHTIDIKLNIVLYIASKMPLQCKKLCRTGFSGMPWRD